jgi:hypothetical protein
MASRAAWARFHFAVRAKGVGEEPIPPSTEEWVIRPFFPPLFDEEDNEIHPGCPRIVTFVKPVQFRALSVSVWAIDPPSCY